MSAPILNLEVDGRQVQVSPGSTVMDAAHKLGIYVPHFCYHKKLSIAANCRMCLVQVEKAPKPLPACATPAAEGMKVYTASPLAVQAQKSVMEFLLDQPSARLSDLRPGRRMPAPGPGGRLRALCVALHRGEARRLPQEPGAAVSAEEMTRCIQCTRCVRFGQEIAGAMELGMIGRGEHSEIVCVRRPHGRLRAFGQHDRHLPGRRAHVEAVQVRGATWSSPAASPCRRTTRSAATLSSRRRATKCCACCRSRTRRSTNAGSPTRTASATRRSRAATGSRRR